MIFITCLFGCKKSQYQEKNTPELIFKYKEGQVVFVNNEPFAVRYHYNSKKVYSLKKFNCSSEQCNFDINEDQITLKPNDEL